MKYRRTTIRTAIAGAGFAALILTSCSSPDTESQPTVTETVTVTPSPIPSITDPESSGTGSLTARPEGPPVLAFGERFDYSDGVIEGEEEANQILFDYAKEKNKPILAYPGEDIQEPYADFINKVCPDAE